MQLRSSHDEGVDVIILAGGLGTRLRAVVSDLPKVLAPVNGRPYLDILLTRITRWRKARNVVLAVGYMAEKLKAMYGHSKVHRFKVFFSEEEVLLGTGGGIKKALSQTRTDHVLILNGDSFVDLDLDELYALHKEKQAAMTIAVTKVENANRYGSVILDDTSRVLLFEEKSQTSHAGLISCGVYIASRSLFQHVAADVPFSLEHDLMPRFLKAGVYGFVTQGKFIDMGTPESYAESERFFKDFVYDI